jgi:hypothetical protein
VSLFALPQVGRDRAQIEVELLGILAAPSTRLFDDGVARWVCIWAAEHETRVSRLVGEVLRERMLRERDYHTAMEEYLSTRVQPISGGAAYPFREGLRDRSFRWRQRPGLRAGCLSPGGAGTGDGVDP